LIAGGISGISSACVGPGNTDTATTEDSDFASGTAFNVDLELSCGELVVERGSGSSWAVEAEHDPDHPPKIEGSTTALSVTQGGPEGDLFVLLSQQPRNEWKVELPATASISMQSTLNASNAEVSLGEAPLALLSGTANASNAIYDLGTATTPEPARLDLTYNASAGRLALPVGSIIGNITLNVSDLELCIPVDAEVRLELESVLATDDIGESGLARARDGWQSAGYDIASSRIDLSITSTVSRISIERPEVCS
jgi:hypothetical protein